MVRLLFALVVALFLAAFADAGLAACGVRGSERVRVRERLVHRERHVERGRLRGAPAVTAAPATVGGGCVGTVAAPPVRVGAGCSGYTGPALMIPPPAAIPVPLPPKK
jgi:hypothetical protein